MAEVEVVAAVLEEPEEPVEVWEELEEPEEPVEVWEELEVEEETPVDAPAV